MGTITIKNIVEATAGAFDLAPAAINGNRKQANIVKARQLAYWIAADLLGQHFMRQIGEHMGRDHTTVMYGIKKAEYALEHDEQTRIRHGNILHELQLRTRNDLRP